MRGSAEQPNPAGGSTPDQMAYRVRTAARLLDVSERVMWELVRTGQVESVKLGAARLITRASLQRYLDRLATETHPPSGPANPPPPPGPGRGVAA